MPILFSEAEKLHDEIRGIGDFAVEIINYPISEVMYQEAIITTYTGTDDKYIGKVIIQKCVYDKNPIMVNGEIAGYNCIGYDYIEV